MSPPIEPCAPGFTARVLRGPAPFPEVTVWPSAKEELQRLLEKLDRDVYAALVACGEDLASLVEIEVQIGRKPEALFHDPSGRGPVKRVPLSQNTCTEDDIRRFDHFILDPRTRAVHPHKRSGINGTLHRLSVITHPLKASDSYSGELVIGVTARVGRAMEARDECGFDPPPYLRMHTRAQACIYSPAPAEWGRAARPLPSFHWSLGVSQGVIDRLAPFLVDSTESLLLIGRPGVGKTTLLREIAKRLSANSSLVVVVVDKTCEIAGDGVAPHAAIGSARWMPVGRPGLQAQILREGACARARTQDATRPAQPQRNPRLTFAPLRFSVAAVENQSPSVIIVDEISTSEEVS